MTYFPPPVVDDWIVTGGTARSALNDNLLVSSGSGSYDTFQAGNSLGTARSMSVQINGSSGIASGQIIFEGSNDDTNWVAFPFLDDSSSTAFGNAAATSIAASTTKMFSCKLNHRYVRVRISTGFSGGTVSAIARVSTADYVPRILTIGQSNTAYLAALATIAPRTSGGHSVYPASLGNTVTSIKGSAGQVYGYDLHNPNAAISYVQFFNAATGSVTLGTTAPFMSVGIPANSRAALEIPAGVAFSTAISVAATTTRTGSTAPSSPVDINILHT